MSEGPPGSERSVPLWLRLGYTAWLVPWTLVYARFYGPANFLWLCDLANFVVLIGLWRGSALLVSSQAVGVLLVQLLWAVDFLGRLLLGFHPLFGATAYMFSDQIPIGVRALSLFHLAMPPLLLWGVDRLGYDPRGWRLQTALTWVVLPICFLFTDPERNLNWVWRPFDQPQEWLPPWLYLVLLMAIHPLGLYLPAHLALQAWTRRRGRRSPARGA